MKSAWKTKTNRNGFLGFQEAEGRKHRMVRAVEGKKKFHCTEYGMRSLFSSVPGVVCVTA